MEKQGNLDKENELHFSTGAIKYHCGICHKIITETDKDSFFTEGLCECCAMNAAWGD
jgi:hypothetical protein